MRHALAAPTLAFLAATALWAAPTTLPPRPTKYATDRAKAFDAARLEALNERLAQFERDTSNQVLVYVDRRLPANTTLEEMASAAMREWGVGQKGKRNGVALFVFVDDRKMRIEVGYGLEGALPDAAAHRITDGVIKPFFKKNDYAGGVEAGVNAILAAVHAEGNRGSGVTAAEQSRGARPANAAPKYQPTALSFVCPFAMLIPLLAWWVTRRPAQSLSWGSLAGSIGSFVVAIVFTDGMWFWGGALLLLAAGIAFFVRFVKWANSRQWTSAGAAAGSTSVWTDSGSSSWSSSSDSSSSWDSGSSSSDFSGGGGDSGGGGSSDSW